MDSTNRYCDLSALRNEADVEQNFISRLLHDFGYSDAEIRLKESLKELSVGGMRGHPQQNYRPDFGIELKKRIRLIVEAKDPDENLDAHVWQPRAYCVLMNGEEAGEKPVRYYLLTNGRRARLYDPDVNDPLLELVFSDFIEGNEKFRKLKALISKDRILLSDEAPRTAVIRLEKKSLGEVNAAFAWCHQHIYSKDDLSQSEAFSEFVKVIALKLMSDRRIRDRYPEILDQDAIEVPISQVDFSLDWVERQERYNKSPINDLLFRKFMEEMEREIATGVRKRIFERNDHIRLKPETIKGVVKKLEGIFLFGIDADLNGRLFETFLNATMRGKDLGQFFTPRSLVKLGTALARIRVETPTDRGIHTDTVADACCGSGGFLIDALADMWAKIDRKSNLSDAEKSQAKQRVANHNVVGVDVANAPKLARIARLNMYLHGDGGSRIFHLNALNKEVPDSHDDEPETRSEKQEFRTLIASSGFDIVLTNPPFAKAVDRTTDEGMRLLDQYDIGRDGDSPRQSVRSAQLFAERYRDMLRPGGTLVTIIDDGILSGDDYAWFRRELRSWFIIRAIVSLPGDAFQRSNARVKTSYLVAEKRDASSPKGQSPVFMYPCQHVGIDDPKRQRARPGDAEARIRAEAEIKDVIAQYEQFLAGANSKYAVPAERIQDRLDVKNCLVKRGRSINLWKDRGFSVYPLGEILQEREYGLDEIVTKEHPEPVRVAVVRYEGIAEAGDDIFPADGSYAKLYPVRAGDVLISNIAASHGSIAVVPDELDGAVVSSEYTVLRAKAGFDPTILQLVLRSPEVRSDILLSASGANRTRAKWDAMREIEVPYPGPAMVERVKAYEAQAETAKRAAIAARENARNSIESDLLLTSAEADVILAAFKPPK